MKTIEEIRNENLKTLVAEAGGTAQFAERAARAYDQISAYINENKRPDTGKQRSFNSATARHFEQAMGRQTGWMDNDHSVDAIVEYARDLPDAVRNWIMRGDFAGGETPPDNHRSR